MISTLMARAAALALLTTGVAFSVPSFAAEKMKPLADGFPNKPITIVIADDAGTREGVYAVNIQSALAEVSPVEILVSNEPGPTFGRWFALGDVATREGGLDGYYLVGATIPGVISDLAIEPITQETGLTIDDFNPVIVTETIPYVGVQRKNAPWGATFADMVKYAKENPGKVTYISNQVGSGNDIAMEWIAKELGIKFNKIPAPGAEEQAAAMGAGEADWALVQAPAARNLVQADKAEVTFVTGDTVPAMWADNKNITTAAAVGLPPAPFGILQGFIVPKAVPDEHREWLFQLIKAATEVEVYKAREKTVPGLTIKILNNEEANAAKHKIFEYVEPVVRDLGMHFEQR